jgi:uncharacterized protein YcbX
MPTLSELNLYPIKSCGAVMAHEATITAAGLMSGTVCDREWMLVDEEGHFLTQRRHPEMALIRPQIEVDMLTIRMPGMPLLEVPLSMPANGNLPLTQVHIWNDQLEAHDCGRTAAQWFSDVLETKCRLVRFPKNAKRIANPEWTDGIDAPTLFSDGFPVLVISEASLADLNQRLMQQGRSPLPMNRFRPNLVLSGVDAFEEDYAEAIMIGDVVLKPVKPCPRCPIPSIDQATGEIGPDPLDILRTYRVNPKVDGGITFGMNAIVLQGAGKSLRIGQAADVTLAF